MKETLLEKLNDEYRFILMLCACGNYKSFNERIVLLEELVEAIQNLFGDCSEIQIIETKISNAKTYWAICND